MENLFVIDRDAVKSAGYTNFLETVKLLTWKQPSKLMKFFGSEAKPILVDAELGNDDIDTRTYFHSLVNLSFKSVYSGHLSVSESDFIPVEPYDSYEFNGETYYKLCLDRPRYLISGKFLKKVSFEYMVDWYVDHVNSSREFTEEFDAETISKSLYLSIVGWFDRLRSELREYYSQLELYLHDQLIKGQIHLMEMTGDSDKNELKLEVWCTRPGIIIGRRGMIIDWFTRVIQKYLDNYNKQFGSSWKFKVEIIEYDPFYMKGLHDGTNKLIF